MPNMYIVTENNDSEELRDKIYLVINDGEAVVILDETSVVQVKKEKGSTILLDD